MSKRSGLDLAALAYEPGESPLHRAHPVVSAVPLAALGTIALVAGNPLIVVSVGLAAWVLGSACGSGRAMRQALKFSIPLAILMIVVNGLVSHGGSTVLFRAPEIPVVGGTITLEAFAAGAVIALRVIAVALLFAVWSSCVDPDRVLAALRPIARHSALTATLVSRLVPVAAADFARLREAADLRGPGAAAVGKGDLARRVVAGSLDRSVDVAATLELRGHSLPRPRGRDFGGAARNLRSGGVWPLVAGVALIAVATWLLLDGAGRFDPYPEITIPLDGPVIALALLIPLLASAALIPWGLGARRWNR